MSQPHPDAVLIRACASHVAILEAYISNEADLDMGAYQRTHDLIATARAQSFAGIVAKAGILEKD